MKRAVILAVLLAAGAAYVYLQTLPPSLPLATAMPGGALLYLEASDFGGLLRDWDNSAVKSDWLASANYAVFSRSNLFSKLSDVYGQYAQAAGFEPGLKGIEAIAGDHSALALYEIREVEFLYVTRLSESALAQSQLWALRAKFQQRQAGGTAFYVRTDNNGRRTVAFAFAKGYLFLATRDDLVAQALELVAGASNPSVASDRWYRDATASAQSAGEVRLVMNLESLVKSVYFRSYWIQRNASEIRPYRTGIADVRHTADGLVETRSFLRSPDAPATRRGDVSALLALAPPDAGLYKVWPPADGAEAAAQIVGKLIGSKPEQTADWRTAPWAAPLDSRPGAESDLETRIDEQPLPSDPGLADAVAALTKALDANRPTAALLVQSSAEAGGPFIQTPAVVVLDAAATWDRAGVERALATAAGKLWSTAQLGAGWIAANVGSHAVDRVDGLGTLLVAARGPRLFLSNDANLLAAVLDRAGNPRAGGPLSYAAGFRHTREQDNYERIMRALDYGAPSGMPFGVTGRGEVPSLFSGNLASFGRVLSGVSEMRVNQNDSDRGMTQTVVYQVRK